MSPGAYRRIPSNEDGRITHRPRRFNPPSSILRVAALSLAALVGALLVLRQLAGEAYTQWREDRQDRSHLPPKLRVPETCRRFLPPPQVHMLLPATDFPPRVCKTLAGLLVHDYNVTIINFHGQAHHSAKIFEVLRYLEYNTSALLELDVAETLPERCRDLRGDIVIATDAYDSLVQQPLSHFLDVFDQSPAHILFSAEKGCHPPGEEWCDMAPESPLPRRLYGPQTDSRANKRLGKLQRHRPRWLNSGFVMGHARDLHDFYSAAASEAAARMGSFQFDQSILGPLWANGSFSASLDYWGRLSMPQYFFEDDLVWAPTLQEPPDPRFFHDEVPWHQYSRITHERPGFVHFNGHKWMIDRDWELSWYGGGAGPRVAERVRTWLETHGRVKIAEDEWRNFPELCLPGWDRLELEGNPSATHFGPTEPSASPASRVGHKQLSRPHRAPSPVETEPAAAVNESLSAPDAEATDAHTGTVPGGEVSMVSPP